MSISLLFRGGIATAFLLIGPLSPTNAQALYQLKRSELTPKRQLIAQKDSNTSNNKNNNQPKTLSSPGNVLVAIQPDSAQFDPPVPDTQIIAPTAPNWDIPNKKFESKDYILPPPPANESQQTRLELEELQGLAATRNNPNVIATINRWNNDPPPQFYNMYFDFLAQTTPGFTPPLAARCYVMLNQGIYYALLSTWYNKFTYLRPRPDQVTGFQFSADPKMPTPAHPSYPAGHSAIAGAFIAIGPACFPNTPVEQFVALGREASFARRQGGIHYYSDTVAGEALGYAIGNNIVNAYSKDGSPLSEEKKAPPAYSRQGGRRGGAINAALKANPKVTVTAGPQLVNGRILLVPITPFPAPPPVGTPPAPLNIPPAP